MDAWQYKQFGVGLETALQLQKQVEAPTEASLSKNQVLIEVVSASINPVDYKIPEMGGVIAKMMIKLPAIPGLDFCGQVLATHKECTGGFSQGQYVFGAFSGPARWGTLGQRIVVDSSECVLLPMGVDPDQGAATGTAALTAYQAVVAAGPVKAGSKIFINGGSGGVGTFAVQFAKAWGAHVTTTCSTRNVELCKKIGADEVIDYSQVDVMTDLKQRGQSFDLVIDNVGTPSDLYQNCHLFLAMTGMFVQVSANPTFGGISKIVGQMLRPKFLGGGARSFHWVQVKTKKEDLEQISTWLADGAVKSVIDQTFEFEDVPKAFETLKKGRASGKIVVHVKK